MEGKILLYYKCRYCNKMFVKQSDSNSVSILEKICTQHLCGDSKYGIADLISIETEKKEDIL